MLGYLIATLAAGMAGLLVYIYYLRKGQFDDIEAIKYQIFHDQDDF